jgi:copper chaperone CopZ
METKQFKTNFKCSGCSSKVDVIFKNEPRIKSWDTDLAHADKVLTVTFENITEAEILQLVKKAGYSATAL